MRVTIVKDAHGQECVHRAGCADIKKRGNRVGEAWTADFADLEELYASYWDCIADEAVANDPETYPTLRHVYYAWQGEFNVLPCANELDSMQDPASDPQPEGSKGEESPKMDATQYKAHRAQVMRDPDAMVAHLIALGIAEADIPVKRVERIKLHDERCKPEATEPEETSQPTPEPAQDPKPRTRTRKPAAKAEPKPVEEPKDEPQAQTPPRRRSPKPAAKPQPDLSEHTVPFAPLEARGNRLVATCPACGKTFVEKADATGEQTTDNYAQHYMREHKHLGETAKPEADAQPKPKPARGRKPKPAPQPEPACGRKAFGKTCTAPAGHDGKHVFGAKAEPKPEPAKPAARGRKPAAKADEKPAKPATRGRKAQPKPEEPKAAANGTKPHAHKQELARAVVNLVAEHFADASEADKERLSYWLRNLPVGNPDLPGNVGGHLRYWPKSLPRPVGIGWYEPEAAK